MSDAPRQFGPETQGGIYLRGLGGATPDIPTNFIGLETAAKQKMSPEAWAYTAGSAGLEMAADANRADQILQKLLIHAPRIRSEVAQSIHRRKTPELSFVVVRPEEPDHAPMQSDEEE